MTDSRSRIIWRVSAADSSAQSAAFDALIIPSDRSLKDEFQPSRLVAVDVPFERELPDIDLTLIVRTNSADVSLVAECDVLNADGSRRVYGRSRSALAVFVCSGRGILVTGLPAPTALPSEA